MLNLRAKAESALSELNFAGDILAKVTTNPNYPLPLRAKAAFLYAGQCDVMPLGFAVTLRKSGSNRNPPSSSVNDLQLSPEHFYLADGDVVRVAPDLKVNVLYRRSASVNSLLVTEQCNSFCVMCSQPPKAHDDSHLIAQWIEAIPFIDESCPELIITGGEPTLLGAKFFELLQAIKSLLPRTALHILTNGRNFKDIGLAERLASIHHPDLMLGIPLYSDVASIHDYVVQADGAYDETLEGIINLKRHGVRIELRVVIHAATYKRLPKLAQFIARNLQFVDQVSLMGLELMGFARANLDEIWIDPTEYQDQLAEAVDVLTRARICTKIFNHQLCLLRPELRRFAVKSISDWKREYMAECEGCSEVGRSCGGFFASARHRYSKHIRPIPAHESELFA